MERKALLKAKAAAPNIWALFESAMFEAMSGGSFPAWINLVIARAGLDMAAPKESEGLWVARKKSKKYIEREEKKKWRSWKLLKPRGRVN